MASPSLSNQRNQRDRIISVLLQAPGAWVCGRELAAISLQYNARVFEARHHLLLNIENRTEITEDGTRLSWFRLLLGAGVRAEPGSNYSNVGIITTPQQATFPGFLCDSQGVHRDDN